jgi:two-component system NtrC family response regulator
VLAAVCIDRPDDGLPRLRSVEHEWPLVPVVLFTGWADSDDESLAGHLGAEDYVSVPVSAGVLVAVIGRALAKMDSTKQSSLKHAKLLGVEFIAASPPMRALLQQLPRLAASQASILINGETGTGKELLAGAIHRGSGRCGAQFVPVNCGGIPAGLVESELFGYRKGAFTGAATDKPGLVEEAHHGTLFLDEIGELPLADQSTLLRFLESGELRRLGETRPRRVDARLVSATNKSLAEARAAGTFRNDLFFRLAVAVLTIPPLRDRPEDLEIFVQRWNAREGQGIVATRSISPRAMHRLKQHPWPGNLRELRNVLERCAIRSLNGAITLDDVHQALNDAPETAGRDECARLRIALEDNHWSMGRTAARLGISRWTLRRRCDELNIIR